MLYQKNISQMGIYDVVVCGGGFTGFAAAYAAAREGAKVLLVERNASLGGVGTNALVNHILGVRLSQDGQLLSCVGGIFSEIEQELLQGDCGVDCRTVHQKQNPHGWKPSLGTGLIFNNEAMKLLLEQKLKNAGVKILYCTDIIDVVKQDSRIRGIVVHNKSGLGLVEGSYFIDATGDGDICAYAGCEFSFGDEEGGTAAASLEMHVENVDYRELSEYMEKTGDLRFQALIPPLQEKGIWKFPYEIFISVMLAQKDVFMINTIRQVGVNGIDAESVSEAVIDGRKENFELFEVMRAHFPGFKNARIRQIAPVLGIRETRRIQSEYTLTVEDLITGAEFDDSIALSAYSWDMPHPKKPSLQPYHGVKRKSRFTEIPYRCLLPRGIPNLIAAGRCVGVEREALGVVRVMGPCFAMGEAVGIASAMALEKGLTYRDVDVRLLQSKIAANGGLTHRNQIRRY